MSDLPLPPAELRLRVGTLEGEAEYEAQGHGCLVGIRQALPVDYSFAGKRVLDFGCGAGRTLRHLIAAAPDAELLGCDVHAPSIAWINEHLSPPLHAFVNGVSPPLALDDESIDLVYALSVFTHLADDWARWLVELHRILRPGGLALVTFLNEVMWDQLVGRPFFQEQLHTPWDEDATGMLVTNWGMAQDDIGPCVYHSEWWLRERFGRAFDIEHVQRLGFAQEPDAGRGHGFVLMRKRDVPVDVGLLEAPGPLDRELRAVQTNLAFVHREMAQWRTLAAAAGNAFTESDERAKALDARVKDLSRQVDQLTRPRAATR